MNQLTPLIIPTHLRPMAVAKCCNLFTAAPLNTAADAVSHSETEHLGRGGARREQINGIIPERVPPTPPVPINRRF
jgi:hypothetical protein